MLDAFTFRTLKDIVDSPDRIRPCIPESWKYVEEKDDDDEGENERKEKISRPVWSPKKPQWDCVSILSELLLFLCIREMSERINISVCVCVSKSGLLK